MFSDKPGPKSEKALGAMPKGPFIVGEYHFLDCAEFENVCCLSIGAVILKVFFQLRSVSKIGPNCNIKIEPEASNFHPSFIQIFF